MINDLSPHLLYGQASSGACQHREGYDPVPAPRPHKQERCDQRGHNRAQDGWKIPADGAIDHDGDDPVRRHVERKQGGKESLPFDQLV
jgi:hypothetical protein